MKKQTINLTVNGQKEELSVLPNDLLINILREKLHLTGIKYGCGMGQCGGCTVLVDGEPLMGCLTLAVMVDGSEIVTIEGIQGTDGALHPLQEAFLDNNAIQCGFCTPGMILTGKDLLEKNPSPTEEEIREHLKGNLCRCTGYNGIVRAIKSCKEK